MTKICILGGSGLIGSSILTEKTNSEKIIYSYYKNEIKTNHEGVQINIPKDYEKLQRFLDLQKPDVVVNTISKSNPYYCEENQKETFEINVEFVKKISELSNKNNFRLIQFSSDYVFDGEKGKYTEKDKPNPINNYGNSKYMAEKFVLKNSLNTVIRTSQVFGKNHNARFFNFVIENLRRGEKIDVYDDIFLSPTFVDDLITSLFKIIRKSLTGIFHVSGSECISKYEFAKYIAKVLKFDENLINPVSIFKSEYKMNYPSNTCLDNTFTSTKLEQKFHSIEESLELFKNTIEK